MEDFTATEHQLPTPRPLHPPRARAAFPTDALPEWLREWVRAEATATQTPEDLAGSCSLAVLSTAAGGRVEVEARPGWREPLNTFHLPVLRPGSRKSAVIGHATEPLQCAEEALMEDVKARRAEAVITRGIAEKVAKTAKEKAAAGKGDPKTLADQAIAAQAAAEAIEILTEPRLIADDATPEAVTSLLADHGGRIAIISAEGGIFDVMGGRYSNAPNLDVYLKGHAGDPIRVDRKGRPSEFVKHPALTVLLTVQPFVLSSLAHNLTFGGRGLTARFLYSLPVDNVGRRDIDPPPMSPEVREAYESRMRTLVVALEGWTDPAVLHLDDEAKGNLREIMRAVEPRLVRDGAYGPIREWASKLVGAVLRLAGLLHVAEGPEQFRRPISRDTLQRASLLGGYYVDHALAAFDQIGDEGVSDAAYLLRYFRGDPDARRDPVEDFTERDLFTALSRGRFPTMDVLKSAVTVLEEHGFVLRQPMPERKGPGRKPSLVFRVHPAAESAESAESPAAETYPAVSLHCADTADSAEASDASEDDAA